MAVPMKMKALQYSEPGRYAVLDVDIPIINDDEVLVSNRTPESTVMSLILRLFKVKIAACGVCGTDLHYHKGEFIAKFPLTPGHEAVGTVMAVGRSVSNFTLGQRVAADPLVNCQNCSYCIRGQALLCDNLTGYGGNVPGGFAEYCKYPGRQLHAIGDISDLEAVLVEPAACAAHGIERMAPHAGSTALLFGCGPTGILLAQLMRLNGVVNLTIASKAGPKLRLAEKLKIADSYICISDDQPENDMKKIKLENPHGFDIVVEATGASYVLSEAVNYVRKGGKLVVYGVYDDAARINWSPSLLWTHEITVIASFCSAFKFPTVLEYFWKKKLCTEGIVSKTFRLDQWAECLQTLEDQSVVKAAIVFD